MTAIKWWSTYMHTVLQKHDWGNQIKSNQIWSFVTEVNHVTCVKHTRSHIPQHPFGPQYFSATLQISFNRPTAQKKTAVCPGWLTRQEWFVGVHLTQISKHFRHGPWDFGARAPVTFMLSNYYEKNLMHSIVCFITNTTNLKSILSNYSYNWSCHEGEKLFSLMTC